MPTLITNKNRKRQLREFIDKDHEAMYEFYEILNGRISKKNLLKKMQQLIESDKNFYDPYLMKARILFSEGKNKEGGAVLKEAYERAAATIADSQGRWPKEMPWDFLENRHLMRAIEEYACWRWEKGNTEEPLDIFHRLLQTNPNDNQGIRYYILAIRMGLRMEEWQKPFEAIDEDGEVIGLDAFKVNDWFDKSAPQFPDDFQWLLEIYARADSSAEENTDQVDVLQKKIESLVSKE